MNYTTYTTQPSQSEADFYGCDVESYTNVVIERSDGQRAELSAEHFARYVNAWLENGLVGLRIAMHRDSYLSVHVRAGNVPSFLYGFFAQYSHSWGLRGYSQGTALPVPVEIVSVRGQSYSQYTATLVATTGDRFEVPVSWVFDHEPSLVTKSDDMGAYSVWQ